MSDERSGNVGAINFAELLTLLFIGLKLTGYINWSWWWVFTPMWVTLALLVVFALDLIVRLLFRL